MQPARVRINTREESDCVPIHTREESDCVPIHTTEESDRKESDSSDSELCGMREARTEQRRRAWVGHLLMCGLQAYDMVMMDRINIREMWKMDVD